MTLPLADLTERDWSRQVYDLLQLTGWSRYHTWRAKHSPAGFPDETIWRDRVAFLELKRQGKQSKCSPAQKETIRGLIAAGAEVYVVRPADLDDIAAVLRHRGSVWATPAWDARLRLVERTRQETA